jgi:hypothetical protein
MGYRLGTESPTARVHRASHGVRHPPLISLSILVFTVKSFERLARRARYARRSLLADPPGARGRLVGRIVSARTPVPARLVLDLGRSWSGRPIEGPQDPERWFEVLLGAVEWLGPVPVTFLCRSRVLPPLVLDLVRFAHRLDCAVSLYGVDGGIDEDMALQLVDRGLQRACLVLGGVTPDLHAEVSGRSVGRTTAAVTALVGARERRGVDLDVVVDFPCTPGTAKDLPAVLGWARQAGADGFAVSPPFLAPAAPAELDDELARRVSELETSRDPFHRTAPGTTSALRATWQVGDGGPGGLGPTACPVAGLRLDLRGCGRFGACPFKRSMGRVGPGEDLAEAWAAGREHFEAVRACPRRCWHQELVPPGHAPPWSAR